MSDTLTPPMVAERWGVSAESVVSLIKRGELRAFTTSPPTAKRPRWRIPLASVEAFEGGKQIAAPVPSQPGPSRRSVMAGIPSVY